VPARERAGADRDRPPMRLARHILRESAQPAEEIYTIAAED
jgi:hypothetical protein